MQNVTLGSCNVVRYAFDPPAQYRNDVLRSIRLEYPDGKALRAVATKPRDLLRQFMDCCTKLNDVVIVSADPEILRDARSVFAQARSVTSRSILDD